MATRSTRPLASRKIRTLADAKLPSEIEEVLKAVRKKNGDQSVVYGGQILQPYRIPLGIFTFDYATLGGIPHNRFTMFDGAKHSGKTTASLRAIRGAQQTMEGQSAVLVDVEGTYDSVWGEKIGVDNDKLHVVRPDTGEQAVDITVGLAHARETSLIVIDSLAAMLPQKEQEASAEDSLVGQQSRLITSMLRKVNGAMIAERKRGHFISVLLINQQRAKIGGWAPNGGEALSNPGGKAVGFFTSLEARWKNKEVLKATGGVDELAFNEHTFSIGKNKMNAGIRSAEFRMLRRDDEDLGLEEAAIDDAETMLAFGKRYGLFTPGKPGGGTLEFADISQSFKSIAEAVKFLYENTEVYWALRCSLIASHAQSLKMPPAFVEYLLGN